MSFDETTALDIIKGTRTTNVGMLSVALKKLDDYVKEQISDPNHAALASFLKLCIRELDAKNSIRVLRESFRARPHCAPWRPMCVKVFYDYSKQVGALRAQQEMAGLFEDFIK